MVNKRRVNPVSELQKRYKDLDKINDEFDARFAEFMGSFKAFEHGRINTFNKMKEIEVMSEYLMKRPDRDDPK